MHKIINLSQYNNSTLTFFEKKIHVTNETRMEVKVVLQTDRETRYAINCLLSRTDMEDLIHVLTDSLKYQQMESENSFKTKKNALD